MPKPHLQCSFWCCYVRLWLKSRNKYVLGPCNFIIACNEVVKKAPLHLHFGTVDMTLPSTDFKRQIGQEPPNIWNADEYTPTESKADVLKPHLLRNTTDPHNRFIEVGVAWLQIGHTHGTHYPKTPPRNSDLNNFNPLAHLDKNSPRPVETAYLTLHIILAGWWYKVFC